MAMSKEQEMAWWRAIKEPCPLPVGTRIELVEMPDDPCPIAVGSLGTVTGGSGAQIHVDWDDHRSLSLIPGIDTWKVV